MTPTPTRQGEALSPLSLYFRQVNETPLLSAEEERTLAVRIAQGDAQARNHLVRANLRLVVCLARSYQGQGLDLPDLVAEGNLGLIRAAEEFDPSMGTRFSTYASYWIKQAMRSAVRDTARTIRLPAYMTQLLVQWRRVAAALYEELGRPATEEEMAVRMSLSARKLRLVKQALRIHPALPPGERAEEHWALEDLATDGSSVAPDAALVRGEEKGQLARLVEALEPRQRQVLRLRFGLDGKGPKTLREIGERLGLTRERVRQIERRALAWLQEQLGVAMTSDSSRCSDWAKT